MARKKSTRRARHRGNVGTSAQAPTSGTRGSQGSGQARSKSAAPPVRGLAFTNKNAILAGSALIAITLGYWLLGRGDITLAPLLLVLGYVVLVPLAIIR